MSYPATLVDGTTIRIERKLENGLLLGEDGKQYRRTTNPLRLEPVEEFAPAAVEPEAEPVEPVEEPEEEVEEFEPDTAFDLNDGPADELTPSEAILEDEYEGEIGA